MKSTITFLLMLVQGIIIAQNSGIITYSVIRKPPTIELNGEAQKQMAALMPKMNESKKVLEFNGDKSIFYDITGGQDANLENTDASGNRMQIRIKVQKDENKYYKDTKAGTYTSYRDIMQKYFLIEEKIKDPQWKMLNEQKDISGYVCMKASTTDDNGKTVEAWFTPNLPKSLGPDHWGGLPGIILELTTGDQDVLYKAENIDLGASPEIVKPKGGDKISAKKFKEVEAQKRKEMEEMYGGNGGVIIRTETR